MHNPVGKDGKEKIRTFHHVHWFDVKMNAVIHAVFDVVVELKTSNAALVFSMDGLTVRIENIEQCLFQDLYLEIGRLQVTAVTVVDKDTLGQVP